jgi:hypothetical protein
MPISLPHVNPGDTITATDWNALVDAINSAFIHIEALEANQQTSGLAITGLIPPTGPYKIGDTLQVLGRNFQTVIGAVRVFLNTTPVLNLLPTSTDSSLQFVIPPLPNIPPNGTLVDLMVTNQTEQVIMPIQIQPQQVPLQGMLTVDWIGIEPATPTPDAEAIIRYKVRAATNKQATWTVTPQIDVASNATAWASQIHVLRSDRSELTNKQISLSPGQELDLLLQIAKVPAGTNGVTFGASLTLAAETLTHGSGVRTFTVGTATPEPDNTISFVLVSAFSGSALVGNTLTVPANSPGAKFQMTATFTVVGTYTVTRTVTPATGWTITPILGTTDSYQIVEGQQGTQNHLRYTVTCAANAATPSQIKVELSRAGETKKKSLTLTLVRQGP